MCSGPGPIAEFMTIQILSVADLTQSDSLEAEVVVVMPSIDLDQASRSARLMQRRAGSDCLILIVHDLHRQGYIATANMAFRRSCGTYFAYVAQDAFAGRLWLKVALNQMAQTNKAMLGLNDGKWHGLLASFGVVERAWAQQQYLGDLFWPEYHSHYGDTELTLLARAQGQLGYACRSVMVEVDWDKEDKHVNSHDRALFRRRCATFFDGRVATPDDCRIFGPSALSVERK